MLEECGDLWRLQQTFVVLLLTEHVDSNGRAIMGKGVAVTS